MKKETKRKRILATVSRELTAEFGAWFNHAEIDLMIQFAQSFPDEAIVVTRSRQLSWSPFIEQEAEGSPHGLLKGAAKP